MERIIVKIIVLVIIFIGLYNNCSYCDSMFTEAQEFVQDAVEMQKVIDPTQDQNYYRADRAYENDKFNTTFGKILGIIRNIGIVIFVIMLMIAGIKFMYGSIEEKANYKETLFPLLVGAVLLLACATIPEFIYRAIK